MPVTARGQDDRAPPPRVARVSSRVGDLVGVWPRPRHNVVQCCAAADDACPNPDSGAHPARPARVHHRGAGDDNAADDSRIADDGSTDDPGSADDGLAAHDAAPTTPVLAPAQPSVGFSGNAECNPATGETTVSWRLTNNGDAPVQILSSSEDVELTRDSIPAGGIALAERVIQGSETDRRLTGNLSVDVGGQQIDLSDEIFDFACTGPAFRPPVTFTFTKTPSVTSALVGDTIDYTYCGQNTSEIPLEVVRMVDDRLGVVIELPSVETVVEPGQTLCNTDVGADVSYVVEPNDAGSVVENNAIVTVRTQEPEPREFQGTADAVVAVASLLREGQTEICHAEEGEHSLAAAVERIHPELYRTHRQDIVPAPH